MENVGINYAKKIYINPDKLKTLRLEKFSQQELSNQINRSKDNISLIERGLNTNPTIGTIYEIANCLDCSIDYLCNRDSNYLYLDDNLKKIVKFYHEGLLDTKILKKILNTLQNIDKEMLRMRRNIIYKILIANKQTIQSLHHLICG